MKKIITTAILCATFGFTPFISFAVIYCGGWNPPCPTGYVCELIHYDDDPDRPTMLDQGKCVQKTTDDKGNSKPPPTWYGLKNTPTKNPGGVAGFFSALMDYFTPRRTEPVVTAPTINPNRLRQLTSPIAPPYYAPTAEIDPCIPIPTEPSDNENTANNASGWCLPWELINGVRIFCSPSSEGGYFACLKRNADTCKGRL